jgi:hypothetical protein
MFFQALLLLNEFPESFHYFLMRFMEESIMHFENYTCKNKLVMCKLYMLKRDAYFKRLKVNHMVVVCVY